MACGKIPSIASCGDENLLDFKYSLDGYKFDVPWTTALGCPCLEEDIVFKMYWKLCMKCKGDKAVFLKVIFYILNFNACYLIRDPKISSNSLNIYIFKCIFKLL